MKLSEFIKKFGDRRVDVDKLIDFIIEDRVFMPKHNEKYYFISSNGAINYNLNNHEADKSIINYQQVYRTEAEAEFARDKAIFKEFMRKEFLRNSDVIDWEDDNQAKYYLRYNHYSDCITYSCTGGHQIVDIHTTSENWLGAFIDEHEDDIKKYYFEVKED